jgi:uncharacterized protein YutE (UPF0331/DUF86 family)
LVDPEVFQRRLARLEAVLSDLRDLARVDRAAFMRDRALQAQAERWLYVAAECVLDLAHHVIADRGWRTPETYRDAFRVLRDNGVLDEGLAANMEGWAGLRNVLAHLYLDVDHQLLHRILTDELGFLEQFAKRITRAAGGE